MSPPMAFAVYFILWWLSFFTVLPMGAESLHEAGETGAPGIERGAPRVPKLRLKAALATGIAAILWLGVAWAVSADIFHMRG